MTNPFHSFSATFLGDRWEKSLSPKYSKTYLEKFSSQPCWAFNRIVQCAAVRKDGWTKARREGFFAMLSATCNVRASAAAMGMTDCGAYYLRRRDPVFAAQWREALAEGYGRLEQALMALALEGIDPAPVIEAGIEEVRAATCGEAKTEGFGAERRRAEEAARAADGGGDAVVPGGGREAGAGARGGNGVIVGSPGGTPTITSVDLALRLCRCCATWMGARRSCLLCGPSEWRWRRMPAGGRPPIATGWGSGLRGCMRIRSGLR
ncbi:hypothetical protein C8J40_106212 [Sphingomonas sp. PP-CC-3A-396]|nr:hypothetical protein C8J40_106212 [Sphingomonas sp. PP-CC-3A-396]